MYFLPTLYDTRDYVYDVPQRNIDICKQQCRFREPIPCDRDVHELCCAIMAENRQDFPTDPQTAVDLYLELRESITRLVN